VIQIKSILVAVLLCTIVGTVSAQTPKFEFELKKIEIHDDIYSPAFGEQIDKKAPTQPQKWAVLFVRYELMFDPKYKAPETALDNGKWLDTSEIKWEFLYKPEKAKNVIQNYVRFSKDVKYVNVDEGKHTAMIFISPKILKRFFDEGKTIKKDLMLRVSFKANGLRQKIKIGKDYFDAAYFANGKLSKEGPKLAPYFDTDKSKPITDVVQSREETPFGVLQYDQFDSIAVEKK